MSAPRIPRHRPLWHDTMPGRRRAATPCACGLGQPACPTPQACERAEAYGIQRARHGAALVLMLVVAMLAMIAGVSLMLGELSQGALP